MNNVWKITLFSAAVCSLILVLSISADYLSANQGSKDIYTALVAKKSRLIKSTVAIGLVKPQVGAEVKVGSQISGIVSELKVGIGDNVTKDQILAVLDDTRQKAAVSIIQRELEIRKVELAYSKKELARLLKLSYISEKDIDLERRNTQIKQAELEQANARMNEAKVVLGYTKIAAPIDGTIASISTYEGETVAASFSAPTFVTIIDLNRQEVQTYVDESDIGSVHINQKVSFRLESYPDRVLEGAVKAINPKPEIVNNVVNYVVLVDFEQPKDIIIRPEMSVHVNFILDERKDVIVISSKSLLREDGRHFVILKDKDEWRKQLVKTGLKESGKVEIVSGVREGDKYLADKNAWKNIVAEK